MTEQPISPAALNRADDTIRDKWWKLHTVDGMKARAIAERTGFHPTTVSDYLLERRKKETSTLKFTPISDLDLMIAQGYGDTPQQRLPKDWRTRKNAAVKVKDVVHGLPGSYNNPGCRCDECRVASTTARRESYRRRRMG